MVLQPGPETRKFERERGDYFLGRKTQSWALFGGRGWLRSAFFGGNVAVPLKGGSDVLSPIDLLLVLGMRTKILSLFFVTTAALDNNSIAGPCEEPQSGPNVLGICCVARSLARSVVSPFSSDRAFVRSVDSAMRPCVTLSATQVKRFFNGGST